MNNKTTIALLVAVAALLGIIVFYESSLPKSWQAAGRGQVLVAFDKEKVEGIDIVSNEDKVELRRSGAKWFMESPVKDRANSMAIAEILAKCAELTKEPVDGCGKSDRKQINDFGLSKPAIRLKLIGRGMPAELLLGKDTAVEGKIYARLEGSREVSVVSSQLRALMTRKPDEFRDPVLADFEARNVKKFSVKTLAGDVDFTREGSRWNIIKPIRARADFAQVTAFLNSVLQTPVGAFLPENKGNLNSYGLSEPRGGVTFQLLGQTHPVSLEIGARDEKTGRVYGRFSNRGGIFLLPTESENILKLLPNNLRDRSLARIDLDAVDRITLEPAGKPAVRLIRSQEEWVVSNEEKGVLSESVPANKIKVLQAVGELQSRKVTAFVADVASDLGKYGLDQPRLRVTFSSYSSENTADTQAGERPLLTIAFGKIEGDIVYARLENEPFVVSVPASVLDLLGTSWAVWRQPSIFRIRPQEIVAVTITIYSEGMARGSLTLRSEAGNWNTGERTFGIVNRDNIAKFVKMLSCITAQHWTDDPGPLIPAMVVEFTGPNHHIYRLATGVPAQDGSCLATFQGKPGIFRLSAADLANLQLRLVDPVTP